MSGKRVAVYPASFDPITNGHLDLIRRGCLLFDEVIVAVAKNTSKSGMFTLQERLEMIEDAVLEVYKKELASGTTGTQYSEDDL